MKKIIFIILILGAVSFGSWILKKSVSGKRDSNVSVILDLNKGKQLRRAELSIDGMWCVSCSTGAEYSLKEIEGVKDAYVGFAENSDGEGWVVYEKGRVSKEQIVKAVEPYKAKITSDVLYSGSKAIE